VHVGEPYNAPNFGVRRQLLRVFARRGLLPADAAQAMAQREHGGGFSVDGSVRTPTGK
jgi:hypothetical protein